MFPEFGDLSTARGVIYLTPRGKKMETRVSVQPFIDVDCYDATASVRETRMRSFSFRYTLVWGEHVVFNEIDREAPPPAREGRRRSTATAEIKEIIISDISSISSTAAPAQKGTDSFFSFSCAPRDATTPLKRENLKITYSKYLLLSLV